ncbi:MAG: sulfatase-like hydrolase/transferase [Halioglobus sp.]|nr:sulfatase-like hydrolase/transferase [Halioglobus sp.]
MTFFDSPAIGDGPHKAWLAVFLLCLLCIISSLAYSDEQEWTNILLIVSDDQRWDELGVVQREQDVDARFPFLRTPNLDALAQEGMRFRNAFVTTSLCSPSRSAILTGQYNHTNGTIDNTTPFPPRETWATTLQAAGYTTAFIGKWHHGDRQWERPGFDYVATFRGQGLYNDTTFKVNGSWFDTKTTGYVDARSVDFAIDFFEENRNEPFAMMIGFKAVHQPFTPMPEYANSYSLEAIKPAPNWYAAAPWKEYAPLRIPRKPRNPPRWMDILRTVSGMDRNVGRLLDALDALQLKDKTLVIFTSDNGFYLGEHQLGDKRSAYEESIRVPLLMRLPDTVKAGTVSDELVLNIDLAPTILDIAGVAYSGMDMQGNSLRPLLVKEHVAWRDVFLYEYWQENEFWKPPDVARTPSILAIRTATHKLITYPEYKHWTQLYDLESDPYEMRNLVGYKKAMRRHAEMCNLLSEVLRDTGYIDRSFPARLLVGLTDSYFSYQAHTKRPVDPRRPPLLHPNC